MNILEKTKYSLNDDLKTFKLTESLIAIVCVLIPVFLRLADSSNNVFRSSISDYVYMPRSYVFGMLLCVASMLFIFNGALYFRNEDRFRISKHGKWYNVVLGVSLMMVIILPYKQHVVLHYFFAGTFFVGNALVTGIFHKKENRLISIIMAILTIASFAVYFLIKPRIFSLLCAEWISLAVVGIHFILQANGKVYRSTDISQKPPDSIIAAV